MAEKNSINKFNRYQKYNILYSSKYKQHKLYKIKKY